jgi:hypothetical protein
MRWRLAPVALLAVVMIVIPILLIQIGAVELLIHPTPDLPDKLVNLVGETTWQDAQQTVRFTLMKLSSLPDPDAVYLQNPGTVIFVWLKSSTGHDLVLYQMGGEQYTILKQAQDATMTSVNGSFAIWVEVPHTIQFLHNGHNIDKETYLVEGNVLIWLADGVTYRLETGGDLETARSLAESLVQIGTEPG